MLTNCQNRELLRFIGDFFNEILNSGEIPKILADANMIPLVKNVKKGYTNPNNYRPISLINIFSKVFELIILQLCPILKQSSALQHGFKKNDSTAHAAYTVRSTIDHYVKSGHKLYACTLDAVKAFDIVSWPALFSKLMEVLPPRLWLALYNYYMLSSFVILYDGATSSKGSITCGVKQGGILSPYLFSFFLNDLLISLEKSRFGTYIGRLFTGVVAYADDIFLLSKTFYGMQAMINMAFEYGKKWKLQFNPDPGKSDIICFNAPPNESHSKFYLGNAEIKMTTRLTHLGFLWDTVDKILLSSHAQSKINKFVAMGFLFINRGLQKAHPNTISTVIKVQLFPLLYGMEIGCYSVKQITIWQRAINSTIKAIYRSSKYCSNKLIKCVGISSLAEYLEFRRSTLENMIFFTPYTQSILFYRIKKGTNGICTSSKAMFGEKQRQDPYISGVNGCIDSLLTLIDDWKDFRSQKQFRELLHQNCKKKPPS